MHKNDHNGNPYMEHQSGWEAEELAQYGFKVYGVRGFKALKKEAFEHAEESGKAIDDVMDLTQIVTYHFPRTAFQLFCVKNVS